jgi:hypothetical protein
MKLVLAPPGGDDLIRLLKAWRFWLLGALAGALLGTAVYLIAPPAYRARATVNVDFHLEQAWPESSDREQFYYLERETRKLEEIAYSDAVLNAAAGQVRNAADARELEAGRFELSQPGNGGWHFYVDHRDPRQAEQLAGAWASEFARAVQTQVAQPSSSLEKYITAQPTQVAGIRAGRAVSMSVYMFCGAAIFLAIAGLAVLFVQRGA